MMNSMNLTNFFYFTGGGGQTPIPPPPAGAHGNVYAKYVVFLPLLSYGSRVCH